MKKHVPIVVAAIVAVALVAAIAALTAANKSAGDAAYRSAQLSDGERAKVDEAADAARKYESAKAEADAAMEEVEAAFLAASGLMDDYNNSVDAGSPDGELLHEIAAILGIGDDGVSSMLEDGKFGKSARDSLAKMKAERLLEANRPAYDAAKDLADKK